MIELKKTEYYEMSHSDLDQLVEEHLGFNPECVACWEMGNDSSKTVSISKKLDKYDKEDLELILKDGEQYGCKLRNGYSAPRLCMVELCRMGIIPEGNYLIAICW